MVHFFLSDFGLFFGRFHPLIVHLPIGFLLFAVVLEFWPGDKLRKAIRISWGLGALTAVVAAGCGWLLAQESGGGDTLFWHRWLGVSVAALSIIGFFLSRKGGLSSKAFGLLLAGLLALAGHQGGNLTHGEDYLFEHAPEVVQNIAGFIPGDERIKDWSAVDTDSINIYHTFLQPAIDKTCAKCHNASKQNGGLRMDEPHLLFLGGDDGSIIAPGDALGSNWIKRVTLPRDNVKSISPQGEPWDYTTVELLAYWIQEGADTLALLNPTNTPAHLKKLLERDYGLDLRPKLFVEKVKAPTLAATDINSLREHNWSVAELVPGQAPLEVKPQAGKAIDAAALQKLVAIASEQVVYLSLENQALTDTDLTVLSELKNLNRLRVNGLPITKVTVEKLAKLRHLESLNLYGTAVTDAVFPVLEQFPALKRLYLWQTKVTAEKVTEFADKHPHIEVSLGVMASTTTK